MQLPSGYVLKSEKETVTVSEDSIKTWTVKEYTRPASKKELWILFSCGVVLGMCLLYLTLYYTGHLK